MKLSKVRRCLRLPKNAAGRDLVVGDLHGHRSLLEQELARLGFDPACDRVLSVGDLTDRGPESLATLSLLEEPWFHAVLGNHELMLLNYLGYYSSRMHSRKSFPSGGGEWINTALAKHRKTVVRLADAIAQLPLALHVESDVPFNVMHGDLSAFGSKQEGLFGGETIGLNEADMITSSRDNFNSALKLDLLGLPFEQLSVQISPTPRSALPITYVGHSPIQQITVHNSYVYIDQGVCIRSPKRAAATPPTVLDHRNFAYWLDGVATAAAARSREVRGRSPAIVAVA